MTVWNVGVAVCVAYSEFHTPHQRLPGRLNGVC